MIEEKFTFFWKGTFSQWYKSQFIDNDGVVYNCAEQYMMYQKAKLFNDAGSCKLIMWTQSPKEQKRLGREVVGFDVDTWNKVAQQIVYDGNKFKFEQNPELLTKLTDIYETTLVEASPYDKIWGIGLLESDLAAKKRETWLGLNWLGEILTELRDNLIADLANQPH